MGGVVLEALSRAAARSASLVSVGDACQISWWETDRTKKVCIQASM